jgi:hypothetical protein
MSEFTRSARSAGFQAVAVAMALPGRFDGSEMRERLIVLRDTLIVLGIQIAFRAGLLLRRWNL